MTDLGAEKLTPRILTADALSEVMQYELNMNNTTVYSKHTTLPTKKNEGKVISGLDPIDNSFKVKILLIRDII